MSIYSEKGVVDLYVRVSYTARTLAAHANIVSLGMHVASDMYSEPRYSNSTPQHHNPPTTCDVQASDATV